MRDIGMTVNRVKAALRFRGRLRGLPYAIGLVLAIAASQSVADARVLSDLDLQRISGIKDLSIEVMTDITQLSRRPDLSSTDKDCIGSALRTLTQGSEELQSYQYLITIETQLDNFGDDNAMRDILRFAVENALKILDSEHRHLSDLSDQCSRSPLSAGKTKQAMQFIESTAAILKSIQPRL